MSIKITSIAKYRRAGAIKFLARQCKSFLKRYENLDYEMDTNGENRVLAKLSRNPCSVVFDVGANAGDWASRAAGFFPGATIHAFEIAPPTYEILAAKARAHKNIIPVNCGLSDTEGEIELRYFPDNSAVTSVFNVSYPGTAKIIKGRVIRGDQYASANKIKSIDLLKVDVEGAEHLVLAGFRNALENRTIEVIQFEYGKANIQARYLLADYYELLGMHGYRIGKIYPTYVDFRDYSLDHEDFIGPNYLAVKKEREDILAALK